VDQFRVCRVCQFHNLGGRTQRLEHLQIESRVRRYTGFHLEPLGEYKREEIEQTVKVVEFTSGERLKVCDEILDDVKMGHIKSGALWEVGRSKTMRRLTRY
jgi:hypothetical protein